MNKSAVLIWQLGLIILLLKLLVLIISPMMKVFFYRTSLSWNYLPTYCFLVNDNLQNLYSVTVISVSLKFCSYIILFVPFPFSNTLHARWGYYCSALGEIILKNITPESVHFLQPLKLILTIITELCAIKLKTSARRHLSIPTIVIDNRDFNYADQFTNSSII